MKHPDFADVIFQSANSKKLQFGYTVTAHSKSENMVSPVFPIPMDYSHFPMNKWQYLWISTIDKANLSSAPLGIGLPSLTAGRRLC